jgi:hypothetical protein
MKAASLIAVCGYGTFVSFRCDATVRRLPAQSTLSEKSAGRIEFTA